MAVPNAVQSNRTNNYPSHTINIRSITMFRSILFSFIAILVIISLANAQNFTNTGTWNNRGATMVVKGVFTNQASGTFDNNNNGKLTLDSTFTQNAAVGNFVTDSGIVRYGAVTGQSIIALVRNAQYGALIANGGGIKTLAASITVKDTVQLVSTLAVSGHQLSVLGASAFTGAGTLTTNNPTDTVNYAGAVNQNVRGTTYGTLITSGLATSTKTAAGPVTVNTNLTNNDTLDFAANAFTYSGAVNGITNASGAVLRAGGTVSFSGTKPTIANLFWYNDGGAGQNVVPANYANLTLTGGTKTISNADTVSVSGVYSVAGAGARTYTGNTFRYNGGIQSIIGESYENLVLAGADTTASYFKNAASGITVGGTLANRLGTFDLGSNLLTLTVPTNPHSNTGRIRYAGTGTVVDSTAGIIEYYGGSGSQAVGLGTYHIVLLTNNATKTVTGGLVRALSDINIPSGAVSVAGGATLQTLGNLTLTSGTSLTNAGLLDVLLNLNNAGSVTNSGTVQVGQ